MESMTISDNYHEQNNYGHTYNGYNINFSNNENRMVTKLVCLQLIQISFRIFKRKFYEFDQLQ